jgi:hypothetical protein
MSVAHAIASSASMKPPAKATMVELISAVSIRDRAAAQ